MQTGGIGEDGNSAKQAVAHKKHKKSFLRAAAAQPRISKQDVHWNAAELEWKIPPDIAASADGEGKGKLFPYLAAEHKYAARKEKDVGFIRKIY